MKSFTEYTLLVVDDEDDLRDAISFDFRRKGFNVLTASNGKEGFDLLTSNKVDLVISDVRMPGGSGIQLLDNVKEKDVFFPVMMLITGFTDMPLDEAYDRGADAVFSKPFDRKALFDAVVGALTPAEERFSRRDCRVELSVPIGIKCVKSNLHFSSSILNIGRGGMFITLDKSFPAELEAVEFKLEVPAHPTVPVEGQGVVRWLRRQETADKLPVGCGIEFNCLGLESMKAFFELIKRHRTKPFIPRK